MVTVTKTSVIIHPTNRQDVTTVLIICYYGMSDLFIETLCIFMCILYMLSVNNIMLLVDDSVFQLGVCQFAISGTNAFWDCHAKIYHWSKTCTDCHTPKYIIGQKHVQY